MRKTKVQLEQEVKALTKLAKDNGLLREPTLKDEMCDINDKVLQIEKKAIGDICSVLNICESKTGRPITISIEKVRSLTEKITRALSDSEKPLRDALDCIVQEAQSSSYNFQDKLQFMNWIAKQVSRKW